MAPLSRLIKDKQKKRNFLRAMMAYLDKAEILNLKETCNALDEFDVDGQWFTNYKQKVDEFNERQFINHTHLLNLSAQFDEEINREIRRRLMYSDPINTGLYSSNLGQIDKEHANKISNSSTFHLSNWLLILILLNAVHMSFRRAH